MGIVLECLPIVVLAACLGYLCIAVKARGFLFVVSVIYLSIQIVYKAVLLFVWQAVPFGFTDIFSLIGAALTIVNYALLFMIFGYVLKHKAQYSNRVMEEDTPPAQTDEPDVLT